MFTRLSFAPFAFSAMSFAILDLIEEIKKEEKRSQVYGSGRKLSVPPDWNTGPARNPKAEEEALIAKVVDKWETIERARSPAIKVEAPAPAPAKQPPAPAKSVITPGVKVDTSPKLSALKTKPIAAIPAIDDTLALKAMQDRRNLEQIALILSIVGAI
jgi:hypothetical protein